MVGVPGRSKGCQTCRKRRKKCDLLQPICGNCIKGKFVCGGYERAMIVVQVENTGKGTYNPRTCNSTSDLHNISHVPSLADVRLKDLNRTTVELEFLDTFWELYLPRPVLAGNQDSPPTIPNTVLSWVKHLTHYVSQSNVLRCALLALSVTKVGRTNGDRNVEAQGMELYGKTLNRLGGELKKPGYPKKFDLLVTARLLALYEQLNELDSLARNWHGHVHGLLKLVQFYSPETFSLPGKHEVFFEARYNGIMASVADRKATFLSSSEWMTKPWQGLQKNPIDTAMDLLAQLPELFESMDITLAISQNHPDSEERIRKLKIKCWNMDTQFQIWYRDLPVMLSSLLQPEDLEFIRQSVSEAPRIELADILAKYGLAVLCAITLYWTCCVLLYDSMSLIYAVSPATTEHESSLLSSPRMSVQKYCTCLIGGVRHYLDLSIGIAALTDMAFPLGCVLRTLHHHSLLRPAGENIELDGLLQSLDGLQKDMRRKEQSERSGDLKAVSAAQTIHRYLATIQHRFKDQNFEPAGP